MPKFVYAGDFAPFNQADLAIDSARDQRFFNSLAAIRAHQQQDDAAQNSVNEQAYRYQNLAQQAQAQQNAHLFQLVNLSESRRQHDALMNWHMGNLAVQQQLGQRPTAEMLRERQAEQDRAMLADETAQTQNEADRITAEQAQLPDMTATEGQPKGEAGRLFEGAVDRARGAGFKYGFPTGNTPSLPWNRGDYFRTQAANELMPSGQAPYDVPIPEDFNTLGYFDRLAMIRRMLQSQALPVQTRLNQLNQSGGGTLIQSQGGRWVPSVGATLPAQSPTAMPLTRTATMLPAPAGAQEGDVYRQKSTGRLLRVMNGQLVPQ